MWVVGLLFIIGAWEAVKDGYRHLRDAEAKARATRGGTGGRRYSGNHSRGGGSSSRHSAIGFWSSEAAHGFSRFRHGFAEGWHRHQRIQDDRHRERERAKAERLENRTGVVAEIRDYKARQAAAQQKIAETTAPQAETEDSQDQDAPLPSEQGRRKHSQRLSWPESGMAAVTPITGNNSETSRPPADSSGGPSDPPPGGSPDSSGGNDSTPGNTQDGTSGGSKGSDGTGSSSPPQEGSSEVPSDTNYNEVLRQSREISEAGEQHANSVAGMRQQVEQMTDGCQAAEVDSQTLGEMADASEAWRTAEQAIKDAQERTAAIPDSVAKRHGLLAEAHQSSPVRAAQREWYEE